MPSNVEIKAKIGDLLAFRKVAKEVSGEEGAILNQHDTFFVCQNGRLKLRCTNGSISGKLIHYHRADASGPKVSNYTIAQVEDANALRETLTSAYGAKGEVRKKRTLLITGQTRIHVDEVENLGNFMELEVALKEGQTEEQGQKIANDLMIKLGVEPSDLVQGAYVDLILKGKGDCNGSSE